MRPPAPFADAGSSAIYVGTTPHQTEEVLKIIREQLELMMSDGLTDEELDRAKGNIKGSLAIGLEDANSRMNRIGRAELTGMEHLTVDETVERISAITHEDIKAVVAEAYAGPYTIGAVGPFKAEDLEEFIV